MTIAFVNDLAANAHNVNSVGNTYVPTSGNLVIVVCGHWVSGGPSSSITLTDTRGNTIPSRTVDITAGASRLSIWLIPNCIGGAGTFTATPNTQTGTNDLNLDVYEYSGADSAATLDGTPATNTATSGSSIASGNLVTSFSGSLIFSAMFDQHSAHTVTHTLGGTQRLNNQNAAGGETSDEMDLIANAGTYSDTVSCPSTTGAEIALIGIKAAAAATVLLMGQNCYASSAPDWRAPRRKFSLPNRWRRSAGGILLRAA